uniref:Enkurin domain-containing protein n=1 Tax=Timema shepardi TaxID=629360 RepID=A0A7R9ANL0_TIMSH|nr:unnamed protein product [Timema shepardi]
MPTAVDPTTDSILPPQLTRPAATTSYKTLRRRRSMYTTQDIPGQKTSEERRDPSTSVQESHVHHKVTCTSLSSHDAMGGLYALSSRLSLVSVLKQHSDVDVVLAAGGGTCQQLYRVYRYLRDRQEQWQKALEAKLANIPDPLCPEGHVPLPDQERKETLNLLRNSYAEMVKELNMMPVRSDTLRARQRKIELESQLNKLEDGIKVFSRPRVFIKVGE